MRFLERLSLIIFSLIILVLSVIACLLIFGILSLSTINVVLLNALYDGTTSNIILGVAVVLILLSIKNIFFSTGKEESKETNNFKSGILMQNDNGKLLISKETLENLVSNITKGFEGTQNVNSKVILDKENNLSVQVTLHVNEDVIIKDLSTKLQLKIKEVIKESADLDVQEVNIQVRNIAESQQNVVKKDEGGIINE